MRVIYKPMASSEQKLPMIFTDEQDSDGLMTTKKFEQFINNTLERVASEMGVNSLDID